MAKFFTVICILLSFTAKIGFGQCLNTVPYGTATVSSCSTGTITNCNWATEYSSLTFNSLGTYTFNSSIGTDYLTLTTATSSVITSGTTPLIATISTAGNYRLHVNTNSSCGTDNVCRITTYSCASSSSGGCISSNPYGSATITACSSGTITSCNWGGEYSQLTIGVTGIYTFYSSNSSDYLTLTDAFNNILFFGTTPLNANITTIGNYRLHVSANSACTNEQTCRITSYSCSNVPCSGTPIAGNTTASSNTVCGVQNVSFGLTGSSMATGLSYQWQSSTNNSSWVSLPTFTNSTMTQLVTSNTYYRCIVSCGTFSANSVSSLVTIGGIPNAGIATASSTTSCAGSSIIFGLNGNSSWPGINYQWQSSPNNTAWTSIFGANSSSTTQMVNSSAYYRCILTCGSNSVASSSIYVASAVPVTYASIPYYETFDNIWQNGCATRNVPNNQYWTSSPLSGNNSWRQQNDGISAGWTSSTVGNVTPHSGAGCANFHSSQATANEKGDLDVLVNFNQNAKYAISFYYINPDGSDFMNVLLSNDAGISYSVKGYYPTQSTWAKKTIYYNAVNTPSCVIKFKGNSDNGTTDLGIDSLSIRLICLNPTITATTSSDTLCAGQTATLTATGATNYTWSPIGSLSNTVVVSPTVNSNYIVTGSNDGLCSVSTNVTILVIPCATDVKDLNQASILIYPNPTKDKIHIDMLNEHSNSCVEFSNALGEFLFKKELFDKNSSIDIHHLPSGVYFYKININDGVFKTGKIIKE